MGLRSWISQRFGSAPQRVDLLTPTTVTIDPPSRAGIDASALPMPWSVARLQALFEAMELQPSSATDQAARLARHQLSRFWLAAPVDQLEMLYAGAIGALQRHQLKGPLVQQDLAQDEQRWRDQLLARLNDPNHAPARVNCLLAVMPYCKHGKLRLNDPLGSLPDWLLNDYSVYCEPELVMPVGLLEPAPEAVSCLPLSDRRGEDAMVWFRDETALQRMEALINAYSGGQVSDELRLELGQLRRVIAQLWLDVEPVQLQTLDQTSVGEVTRALIRSGFGHELLDASDEQARRQLGELAADFSQPGAAGALLATLLFYAPEKVSFDSTDGLPEWCVSLLHELAAEPVQG